jgi:hypothetical protein
MFVPHRVTCLAALALAAVFSGCSEDAAKPASKDVAVADTVDDAAGTTDAATATDTDATAGSDTSAPKFPPVLAAATGDLNFAVAKNRWYRGDLHFHTNHSEDAFEQGGNWMKTALQVADAYRHPIFAQKYPDLAGNALDYIAVTDHRDDKCLTDPDFKHDHLILLPGEEFGGSGHAGIWGFKAHIDHEPPGTVNKNQRIQDAVDEAHAQGALFSPNHPAQDNPWVYDVKGYDGMEVWNGPWSAFYGPIDEAEVEGRAAGIGVENPYIRQAVLDAAGTGCNGQGLRMWQNMLSDGYHTAIVGGSDHHMLVPPGLPTTYAQLPDDPTFTGKVGKEVGQPGILAAIKSRATFVSRSPFSAQIDLTAKDSSGKVYPMGAALPYPGTYTIAIDVSRAKNGQLRLYAGKVGKVAGKISNKFDFRWPDPALVHEEALTADRMKGNWTWTVPEGGGWLHAIVLERRIDGEIPADKQELVASFDKLPKGKAIADMILAFTKLVDFNLVIEPESCDPEQWTDWSGNCMPFDDDAWGTFYIPERVVKLMSTWFEDGKPTEWALGAITSAFLSAPPK